jgi:hypothetical protein
LRQIDYSPIDQRLDICFCIDVEDAILIKVTPSVNGGCNGLYQAAFVIFERIENNRSLDIQTKAILGAVGRSHQGGRGTIRADQVNRFWMELSPGKSHDRQGSRCAAEYFQSELKIRCGKAPLVRAQNEMRRFARERAVSQERGKRSDCSKPEIAKLRSKSLNSSNKVS